MIEVMMKNKRHIYSENPSQKMWDTFVFFENEPTVKQFLQDTYEQNQIKDTYKFAFQNTSKFIYFIKQAKEYFYSADKSNILVKPLLIYYGMMNLMKAFILTKDPSYPSHTGVLRHGITTRKLKKNQYQFHDDEIKVQKEGLLPLFYTLLTNHPVEKIEGNKYKIKELLSLLPELRHSYQRIFKEQLLFPIKLNQKDHEIYLSVSKNFLDFYQHDLARLTSELNQYKPHKDYQFYTSKSEQMNQIQIGVNLDKDIFKSKDPFQGHPMFTIDYKGYYYLRPFQESRFLLPETIIDYMIMYNLGMLCRYETELWGDIIFSFSSEDMYLINEFVNITLRTFPNRILNDLFREIIIFDFV